MFLELIATFAIGFAAAGVSHLINRLSGRRLPRWLIPVSAGLAMIGFTIFNEYTWFQRTKAALPEGVSVAKTVETSAFYRPWTYAFPYVDRFIALDRVTMRRNTNLPDQRIFDLLIYGRWSPVHRVRSVFNCKTGERADLTEGVSIGDDGRIIGAAWVTTGADDPLMKAACKEA